MRKREKKGERSGRMKKEGEEQEVGLKKNNNMSNNNTVGSESRKERNVPGKAQLREKGRGLQRSGLEQGEERGIRTRREAGLWGHGNEICGGVPS